MFSLVKTALSTEPKSKFTLFFGNRASSAVLFREEIEDLKNLYMDRFSLVYVASRETRTSNCSTAVWTATRLTS